MTHCGSRALEFAAMRNANLKVFADRNNGWNESPIERVPAAWKCSLENRPYGGEAQVVSSAGRPLSKFMRHPRAQPQRLCGASEAQKTRRILVGRAPITTKQFVEDFKAAFS
jgi:hypothetical protein